MTAKGLKLIILIGAVLTFLVAMIIGVNNFSNSPQFCIKCHEMYPQYATWSKSTHSSIACNECHIASGVKQTISGKVFELKDIFKHFTGKDYLPITVKNSVGNETCLECHSNKRPFTPDGDLVMPHYEHISNQMKCTDCHKGLVHGKLDNGDLAKENSQLNASYWTSVKVKDVIDSGKNSPKMELCMNCHLLRKVTLACNACHSGDKKPISHSQKDFLVKHGQLAATTLKDCDFCHAYGPEKIIVSQQIQGTDNFNDGKPRNLISDQPETNSIQDIAEPEKPNINSLNDYTLQNGFCFNCHSKTPTSHKTGNWRTSHGDKAKIEEKSCMICHVNRPGSKMMPTKTYCALCHPAIHREVSKVTNHPIDLKGKTLGKECLTCHPKDVCLSCHQ